MSKKKYDTDEATKLWVEYGIDVTNSTLFLEGDVDAEMASQTIRAFQLFPKDKEVLVVINSPGGDEFSGMAIFDCIRAHPQPVTIRVVGEACSMAVVILQAGDVRQASKHSTIMTHLGSYGHPGDHKKNVKRHWEHCNRLNDKLDEIVLKRVQEKHPDRTMKWWKGRELFDNYMFSDEALDLGLIDEIWDPA